MDPHALSWQNPANSFAYSLGELKDITCMKCCKACSWSDQAAMSIPHESATQEHVQSHLLSENLCPFIQLLQKTHSFWAALLKTGCKAPPNHSSESGSNLSLEKQCWKEKWDEQCGACDHLLHYGPASGLYDLDYLQTLFNSDQQEISTMEIEAGQHGFNVSASQCSVVMNHTFVHVMCSRDHANTTGHLKLSKMISIPCRNQFCIHQPIPDYRQACPKILVVCTGAHNHTVPLPVKTPSSVYSKIFELLHDMEYDLPNMTPCHFLCHSTVIQFLAGQFPNIANPTLSDLHVSLYVQSDIGFKRIVGFYELEVSRITSKSNIALTYSRIYMSFQTAAAHLFFLQQMEKIVEKDTGTPLKWHHLHASHIDGFSGILQWTADQHGGQAKVFQLCSVHVLQNIKTTAVDEPTKKMMCSLVCIEHPDFTGTLRRIESTGGKAGSDFLTQDTKLKPLNAYFEKSKGILDCAQTCVSRI
ncbi:hypothetical protein V8B97DRAFT_2024583 [Scleroderma yunnanense]